jgi:phasin family protein
MSDPVIEQLSEQMKQALLTHQARWNSCAVTALDSALQLFELNVKASRQTLAESSQTVRQLLSAGTPGEAYHLDQEQLRERIDQMTVYASEINRIVSGLAEEINLAGQDQLTEGFQQVRHLSEDVGQGTRAASQIPTLFPTLEMAQQSFGQWMEAGKKLVTSFGEGLAIPAMATPAAVPVRAAPKTASARSTGRVGRTSGTSRAGSAKSARSGSRTR